MGETNKKPGKSEIDPKPTLKAVQRISAVESAAQQLFDFLANSNLIQGDILPSEQKLVAHLGVGRSTIREALQRLAVLGLVQGQAGRGWVVKVGTGPDMGSHALTALLRHVDVGDLFELRMLLEVEIAAMAAVRANPEELDNIKLILSKIRKVLESGEETFEHSISFHEALAAAAHNTAVLKVYRGVAQLIRETSGSSKMSASDAKQLRFDEHAAIVKALERKDPEAARQAMSHHISMAQQWVTRTVKSENEAD